MALYIGTTEIGGVGINFVNDNGTDTSDATLSSNDQLLEGITAYSKDTKYTGTIPTRSANNVSASGATVKVPAGYYPTAVEQSVVSGTLPAPSIAVSSAGLITATDTLETSGYITADSKTSTKQLATQGAKTITPSTSAQTAIASGTYATGDITVAAVPTETKTVGANGTYTPSVGKFFSSVVVDIAGDTPTYQTKVVDPSTSQQVVQADDGYDALSKVTINAIELQSKEVAPSVVAQTLTPDDGYDGLSKVVVKAASLGSATITPKTTQQTATPTNGAIGLSSVTVEAIQTETKDITSNGTYTPASGKYFSSVSVAVPGSNFTTQDKTVAPTTSEQVVKPDSGYNGLSSVTVGAIGTESLNATSNGNYTPTSGKYYSDVTVAVPIPEFTTQAKTVTPTASTQTVKPDTAYNGLSQVTVNPVPTASKTITESGTYSAPSGTWWDSITVDIEAKADPVLEQVNITPSETTQTITPSTGYDGISQVNVSAISSTYIGSGITQKAAATYTPSESTQTIGAGQYLAGAQTINAIPSTYIGSAITQKQAASYTPTESAQTIGAGQYLMGDQTIEAVSSTYIGSGITQKSAATYTPTESAQTIPSGQYLAGAQTIGAISSSYIGSSITQKSAATYTPTTYAQTISSGQYLSGVQTISGDSNLRAANIKSGTSIFNVSGTYTSDATATAADVVSGATAYASGEKITGTLVIQKYYTGTAAPTSSIGSDGDIYLQT